MIYRTPFFIPWIYPSLVWRMPSANKELYLTFDDGPVPGATEFVLHTLDRLKAKATFFCIGDNIRKHPDIFQKILADGHAVGNHTFNHLNGWKNKTDHYLENTRLCDEEIMKQAPHHNGALFRPPYGRITAQQIKALNGRKIVMWDVLSRDYSPAVAPHVCLLNTVNTTRPGSIIVFHDSYKAERNMAFTLPRFIEHFSERGYVFKSLPG
ncbi:MAG TPA: polysaccharide deacetylase family protein [Cyclobacteriaceae bacterium]|nr:polysaccharide deacetylase family protein [Cyclobacteriaceae bacterium]